MSNYYLLLTVLLLIAGGIVVWLPALKLFRRRHPDTVNYIATTVATFVGVFAGVYVAGLQTSADEAVRMQKRIAAFQDEAVALRRSGSIHLSLYEDDKPPPSPTVLRGYLRRPSLLFDILADPDIVSVLSPSGLSLLRLNIGMLEAEFSAVFDAEPIRPDSAKDIVVTLTRLCIAAAGIDEILERERAALRGDLGERELGHYNSLFVESLGGGVVIDKEVPDELRKTYKSGRDKWHKEMDALRAANAAAASRNKSDKSQPR